MRRIMKIVRLVFLLCIILFSIVWGRRLVIAHKARDILKAEIGQRHKEFYVDSIKKGDTQIEVHFVNKDIYTLSSECLVVMKEDGTSEILGGMQFDNQKVNEADPIKSDTKK